MSSNDTPTIATVTVSQDEARAARRIINSLGFDIENEGWDDQDFGTWLMSFGESLEDAERVQDALTRAGIDCEGASVVTLDELYAKMYGEF